MENSKSGKLTFLIEEGLMERNKRRGNYGNAKSVSKGIYRINENRKKRKRERRIVFFVLLLAVLVIGFVGYRFLKQDRGRSSIGRVTKVGASIRQNIMPFGSSIVFYDGTTLHCIGANGNNEWSYQIGAYANYDATDNKIVAWSGNDIYILNEKGRLIYNNKMSDTVQFASAGDNYTAVFIGEENNGVITVINNDGKTVDNITITDQTLEDIGFFMSATSSSGNQKMELMWVLGLNTTGNVISTELQTFQPGRLSTGRSSLGEHIAYLIYDDGAGTLNIVNTREILHYDYRAIANGSSTLIYGYTMRDVKKYGNTTYQLLTPSKSIAITDVRIMYDAVDRMIHIPGECIDVKLGRRSIYGFSENMLYVCQYGDTTFHAFAMPISVSKVLGMLTDNRAVIASGSDIYVVELPM